MAEQGNAGGTGEVRMKNFNPDDQDACIPAWMQYKREFMVQLAAAGLDDKSNKRQVITLLKTMNQIKFNSGKKDSLLFKLYMHIK